MDLGFSQGASLIHRLDPRARVVAAAGLSVLLAVADRLPALGFGLGLGVALATLAELNPSAVLGRLAPANIFLALLWIVLPLSVEGEAAFRLDGFTFSMPGCAQALRITLKCNAILLVCLSLLATVDLVALGHALHHLGLPSKLIHLLLFSVRYLDLLHEEYHRLHAAMRARAFRPRADRRTYRAYGHLVGMLLVNSFDRAERIMAAMRCRGFRGRFYVLRHFAFAARDAVFLAGVLLAAGLLGWMQLR